MATIARKRPQSEVRTRNSRTANIATPVQASPFRSEDEDTRIRAAEAILAQRLSELASLRKINEEETNPKLQRKYATRIRATKNNIKSWVDYLGDNAPREARAVLIPES